VFCSKSQSDKKHLSAVTILISKSKIAIFCQNRPKSKSLYLVSHVSISSCFDFLQQLMDVTGFKNYTISVVIVVLIHVGEVVGLQHPDGTTLKSFILINYTSYTTANFRWFWYIAIVITLGDW